MLFVLPSCPFPSSLLCTFVASVILIVSVDRAAASKVKSDTTSNERGRREGEREEGDADNEAGMDDARDGWIHAVTNYKGHAIRDTFLRLVKENKGQTTSCY